MAGTLESFVVREEYSLNFAECPANQISSRHLNLDKYNNRQRDEPTKYPLLIPWTKAVQVRSNNTLSMISVAGLQTDANLPRIVHKILMAMLPRPVYDLSPRLPLHSLQ